MIFFKAEMEKPVTSMRRVYLPLAVMVGFVASRTGVAADGILVQTNGFLPKPRLTSESLIRSLGRCLELSK